MRPRWPWLALSACALVAFAALAYPAYVVRPFRAQAPGELAVALWLRRWGPPLATVAASCALALAVRLWTRLRWPARAAAASAALAAAACAALSYVNVFELMFRPIDAPAALAAASAPVDDDDMVLSVALGGHARAYPVRAMGYHHVANDWVGGEPVAATY